MCIETNNFKYIGKHLLEKMSISYAGKKTWFWNAVMEGWLLTTEHLIVAVFSWKSLSFFVHLEKRLGTNF